LEADMDEKILTRQEAAKLLGGICLTTLKRLSIPQLRIRRRVFYRMEDIKIWLDSKSEIIRKDK